MTQLAKLSAGDLLQHKKPSSISSVWSLDLYNEVRQADASPAAPDSDILNNAVALALMIYSKEVRTDALVALALVLAYLAAYTQRGWNNLEQS